MTVGHPRVTAAVPERPRGIDRSHRSDDNSRRRSTVKTGSRTI
ncbi:hypothetical protein HSR121_0795 [Halapricum desulfuricans]|uniref:Uncharacterized protein n=1 Tax=Halapricum desulfuricans TaxID=2841257 RepID=A0A897N229_9EURY|nr:hypothetical protein HSR121_0795 [Halapricum desulfuricans]